MPAKITTVFQCGEYALTRICVEVPIPGFSDFITPWLISEAGGRTILVDPGPSCGIPSLKEALGAMGITNLDLVLVTHVHIDHSGGTGLLLQSFPEAQVAAHPRGVPHLTNPARLWESTVSTLGEELALTYGEILPVPSSAIVGEGTDMPRIEIIDTPGHSGHHRSYVYTSSGGSVAFAGDAGGVHLVEGYLRPATPPRFLYETTVASIETLKKRATGVRLMAYGHYGFTGCPTRMLDAALEQLALWRKTARDIVGDRPSLEVEEAVERMVTVLSTTDPFIAKLESFPEDIRQRELYFLRNSARGFILAELDLK